MTDTRLLWLPDVLRGAGLDVRTDPGWETRGRPFPATPLLGVIGHHTASSKGSGEFPSLHAVTVAGNPTTPPPLANLMLGRATGRWLVTASGVANHAGTGSHGQWPRNAANARTIGIEAENDGLGDEPWTLQMVESFEIGVAALLSKISRQPDDFVAHYEWAPVRKVDPRGPWIGGGDWWSGGNAATRNANTFRARVRNRMEVDDMFTDDDRLKLDGLDDFIRKVHHPKEDLVYVEVADETTSGSNITLGGRLKKVEEAVARIETAIAAALAH